MKKLVHLEAMRGVAALVVVVNHLALAFSSQDIWFSAPWFVLLNGGAAVIFFFVLSGYVLTLGPLRSKDPLSIVRGSIKRWPRLAGPVLIAVLLSCALWNLGAFWHVQAAEITGSSWLASSSPLGQQDMSLEAAFAQGLWRTFIYGERYFDPPLWTMKIELYGSFVAFALAMPLMFVRQRWLQAGIIVCFAALVSYRNAVYFPFCLGVALAWLRSILIFELPSRVATPLAVLAIYLLGYSPNVLGYTPAFDFYRWVPAGDATYLHSVASALLIIAISFSPLRQRLDGAIGSALGRYSFPVYLIHILAIFSIGAMSLVTLYPLTGYMVAVIVSVALSLLATVAASFLLTIFEAWWVPLLNRVANRVVGFIRFRNWKWSRSIS